MRLVEKGTSPDFCGGVRSSSDLRLEFLGSNSHLFHQVLNPIIYKNHSQNTLEPALFWAAKRGKLAACIRLLSEGADPNIIDSDRRTPLSWAAQIGHADVVSALLSAKETDPNTPDKDLRTPLLWAAGKAVHHIDRGTFSRISPGTDQFIRGDHLAVVKALLSVEGIQVDRPDNRGRTPLTVAAGSGAESAVEEILRTGKADPNSRDVFRQTPLMQAVSSGSMSIFNRLISIEGLEVDTKSCFGPTAFLEAASNGNVEIMKILLAMPQVDPAEVPCFGDSALMNTICEGHTDAVSLLLADERIDPNITNKAGIPPLVRAAERQRTHIMQMLLDKGAEPDAKDRQGSTALMVSTEKGNIEAIQLLLATGRVNADFDLTERTGYSPFTSVSLDNLNQAVLKILDEHKRRHRIDLAPES
ncbi:unnamed protein product [Penicillium salamii]|uniref:Uncharacterized protein n=1 Tax=Penicillium salamii TaxID=1612424 RepID=A0A9W4JV16_9EURO|nr:unnamed protein product [Penicillium salamii]CAG8333858.1 unnamed protein product [Penicillium salamii]CAG8359495.1 unnamed protein product [Penicillium salamii]CAG8372228.1 unnamed protein product [Penicillium salamii]CAG8397224.1 unnamed protein product [Penicillium salamii]